MPHVFGPTPSILALKAQGEETLPRCTVTLCNFRHELRARRERRVASTGSGRTDKGVRGDSGEPTTVPGGRDLDGIWGARSFNFGDWRFSDHRLE